MSGGTRVDEAIDAIERTFNSAEGMAYLGEDVTMIQHQLQAGALAIAAGCSDSLALAALLHDIGHVIGREEGEADAAEAMANDRDAHHDASGARWLSRWFGLDVTEPVRLHVAAKRFLVATEPDYAAASPRHRSTRCVCRAGRCRRTKRATSRRTSSHGTPSRSAASTKPRRMDRRTRAGFDTHRDLLARVLANGR